MNLAMSPEQLIDPNTSWKVKIATWMVSQGVSTVLLFSILVGIHQATPDVLLNLREGYKHNAEDLQKAADKYAGVVDSLVEQWKQDRSLILDIVRSDRENHVQDLRELHAEIIRENQSQSAPPVNAAPD